MLSDVIRNLERAENLRRDSELTTSTVETFVSERPVFTLNVPETVNKDNRVGDVERNAQELQQNKGCCFHFYHTHTGTILLLVGAFFLVSGLLLIILGVVSKLNMGGQTLLFVAGGCLLMVPVVMLIMKFVAFLASPEQRAAAVPYVGVTYRWMYENSGPQSDFRSRVSSAVRGSDLQVDVREL